MSPVTFDPFLQWRDNPETMRTVLHVPLCADLSHADLCMLLPDSKSSWRSSLKWFLWLELQCLLSPSFSEPHHSYQDVWANIPHKKTIWNFRTGLIIGKRLWECVLAWPELMVAKPQLLMGKIGVVCRRFNAHLFHSGPNSKIDLGSVGFSAIRPFDHTCIELNAKEG